MLNKLKKTSSEGFTIIEVMIVLAIAALILLIVLLAVPALQRNARNTSRRNDASSLVSAINEYISNQNGALPTSAADFTANWKPGYYTTSDVTFTTNANQDTTDPSPASGSHIYVETYADCNSTETGIGSASATVNSNNIVVIYWVEAPGNANGLQEECATAQ
jgi:prepilin-type N-terminal cleavage/methylation domain-containing protein